MKSGRDGGGYAFLVEIMAVILVFAVSATVVVTLFLAADRRAREAAELSGAITAAVDATEIVRASKDPAADFIGRYNAVEADGGYEAWLDPSFRPGGLEEYLIRLDCVEDGGLYAMTVTVAHEDGEAIYSLACASYPGGGA